MISISENCLSKVFLKLKESIISGTSIKGLQTDKATTLSIDVSTTISTELRFVATVTTDGRVKFVSGV